MWWAIHTLSLQRQQHVYEALDQAAPLGRGFLIPREQ